jgi:uncharacterized protein YceK
MKTIILVVFITSTALLTGCGSIVIDPLGGYNERQIEKANDGTIQRHNEEKAMVAKTVLACPPGFKLPDNARAATIRSNVNVINNTNTRTRNNRPGFTIPERNSRVLTNVRSNQNCVLDR